MAKITFDVFRFDPAADKAPGWQEYALDTKPGMTVLQGLLFIQSHLDPSLAFRSACRAAVCGSCAMHINGSYRLACETPVDLFGKRVSVRPLAHLPVIRDLVVEMKPFWDRLGEIRPFLIPGKTPPAGEFVQSQQDRDLLTGVIDCILCGCCYASCPVVATDPAYLGPAAALKSARFILDSRDGAARERLMLSGGENGVWRCHSVFACQEACPKDINPAGAVTDLKMKAVSGRLRNLFRGVVPR
jgi:succinate dehydrogenase / fumarate reductase iron-sulfur subunit